MTDAELTAPKANEAAAAIIRGALENLYQQRQWTHDALKRAEEALESRMNETRRLAKQIGELEAWLIQAGVPLPLLPGPKTERPTDPPDGRGALQHGFDPPPMTVG